MDKEKNEIPKGNRKKERLEITELWMAKNGKNGWDQTFWGEIFRERDENGNETAVNVRITMPDGMIWSRDINQNVCGDNADSIVELRLGYGLHTDPGVVTKIAEDKFFHN